MSAPSRGRGRGRGRFLLCDQQKEKEELPKPPEITEQSENSYALVHRPPSPFPRNRCSGSDDKKQCLFEPSSNLESKSVSTAESSPGADYGDLQNYKEPVSRESNSNFDDDKGDDNSPLTLSLESLKLSTKSSTNYSGPVSGNNAIVIDRPPSPFPRNRFSYDKKQGLIKTPKLKEKNTLKSSKSKSISTANCGKDVRNYKETVSRSKPRKYYFNYDDGNDDEDDDDDDDANSSSTLSEENLKSSSKSSTTSRPASASSKGKLTVSAFLPKYFDLPPTSKRLRGLKCSKVKVLRILDKDGHVAGSFRDSDSIVRYRTLIKCLSKVYSSPEGLALVKPPSQLEPGEIVAGVLSRQTFSKSLRRVIVQAVFKKDGSAQVMGVDIDDLSHVYVDAAYALLPEFYQHPVQVCRFQVSNFCDLYSKEAYQPFFNDPFEFEKAFKTISNRVLHSIRGKEVVLKNITCKPLSDPSGSERSVDLFCGEIDTKLCPKLGPLFVDEFCNYFRVPEFQEGSTGTGTIVDARDNGSISVCTTSSLFQVIDQMINSPEVKAFAEKVTEEDQEQLLQRLLSEEGGLLLVWNAEKTRIFRAEFRSYLDDEIRVFLLDLVKDMFMGKSRLIGTLLDFPNLSPLLSEIPQQAIAFQLDGINFMDSSKCNWLIGQEVKFEVLGMPSLLHRRMHGYDIEVLPKVRIFNSGDVTTAESINDHLLKMETN